MQQDNRLFKARDIFFLHFEILLPVKHEVKSNLRPIHSSQNFLPPLSLGDYGVRPHKISHNRYCSPTESGGVSAFLLLFFQCNRMPPENLCKNNWHWHTSDYAHGSMCAHQSHFLFSLIPLQYQPAPRNFLPIRKMLRQLLFPLIF